ncbi:MAG: chemotaxis protein CheW [Desulfuromonadales bacterium]
MNDSRLSKGDVPAMTDDHRKFLIFSLQGRLYALGLEQIAEVGDPRQLSPIPKTPACYSGALNFHGDIVAVINLSVFLDLPGGNRPGKIIVLHQETASLAFLVDTVFRIVSEGEVTFSPVPEERFAVATLSLPDGEAIQLNIEALVLEAENCLMRHQLSIKNTPNKNKP